MDTNKNLSPVSKDQLLENGFPNNHVDSFLQAAQSLTCVILTRTPGAACAVPLSEGYDAKSFHVKAKSCDFGIAAGFVCFDPLLNKNGAAGALSNLQENHISMTKPYNYVHPTQAQPTQAQSSAGKSDAEEAAPAAENYKSGAIQLQISDTKIKDLVKSGKITNPTEKIINGNNCLVTTFKVNSISISVILVKAQDSNTYKVFYDQGSLYFGKPISAQSSAPNINQGALFFNALSAKIQGNNADLLKEKDFFISTFEKQSIKPINESQIYYYPLMVMTNPHQSYTKPNQLYLNALTGDYDLFAVWPKTIAKEDRTIAKEDIRFAGMSPSITDEEIEQKENAVPNGIGAVFGNISERIFLTAQTINSILQAKNPGTLANRVYHSDEAGRPKVTAVEDCAAFTPDGKAYLIKKDDLKTFITQCHAAGYQIIINKGWMTDLSISATDSMITWSESLLAS